MVAGAGEPQEGGMEGELVEVMAELVGPVR
jgi:hypothetical protein